MKYLCNIREPQRVSLINKDTLSSVAEEFKDGVDTLLLTATEHLFTWKDFPVTLPDSIVDVSNISLDNLISAPEFDECGLLSKDIKGNSRPLNRYQLIQLRRRAEFQVESANFPGEVHTWQISSLFLRGTEVIHENFKEDLCNALAVLVIHAHDRIVGHCFSLRNCLFVFYMDFFKMFLDLLFGWPHINHGDVESKLLEERLRFLTCELSVKSSHRKGVMDFWDTFEQLMYLPRNKSSSQQQEQMKCPPYRFITPARLPIDLRLHNVSLLDRCLTVLNELRQPTRSGWFRDFKEQTISRLRDEGKSLPQIKKIVRQEGLRAYASRLFDAIRQNPNLQSISKGIAEPLIQQATFNLILAEVKESFSESWSAYQIRMDLILRNAHPILYHISEWRFRQMKQLEQQFIEDHKFDIHEMVLAKCVESGLNQHVFFLKRDLTFLRDRERLLREQLIKSATFPDSQFVFRVQAQLLRYWRVYRKIASYVTRYELVDTVLLSRRPTGPVEYVPPIKRSIKRSAKHTPSYEMLPHTPYLCKTAPPVDQELGPQDFDIHAVASMNRIHRQPNVPYVDLSPEETRDMITSSQDGTVCSPNSSGQSEFVVQSSLIYKASTRYFLWRWLAFFLCTYSWLLRLGQLCFITVPFRSAFSFIAFIKPSPIYLKLELDPSTGYLYYNDTFYQDTLISRIRRSWSELIASRRAFDATPSRGMLDKAAARPLHRIWSYCFRGVLWSLLFILIWPPIALLISLMSILIGLTLPVMVPLFSLILHVLSIFFWDAYKPASKKNRLCPLLELFVGHLLIRCIGQFILAFITAFVLCPILTVLKLIYAVCRLCSRSTWDALVFHLVLRNLARIPAREDVMVKRIAGPGIAQNHFYQARPVHILGILIGQLELLELQLWRRQMETIADKPIKAYQRLIDSLSWLSIIPQPDGTLYSSLCRRNKQWHMDIQTQVDERTQALQIRMKVDQLLRIKLSDRDLHYTLRMGAQLTEFFVRMRISSRLHSVGMYPTAWWSDFALNTDDYLGLCTTLLGRTFGEQLFDCIVETDTVFPLMVRDPSLTKRLQDYLVSMVLQLSSLQSLDAAGLDKHSASQLHSPNINYAGGSGRRATMNHQDDDEEEDECLSLASDTVLSSSDIMSQRCTVIPASLYEQIKNEEASHEPLISSPPYSDNQWIIDCKPPDTMRKYTQNRSVPDPISFIHINLPLFPLSAFAPFSYRKLPLPLKSSPPTPSNDPFGFVTSSEMEFSCSCCACPTSSNSVQNDRQSSRCTCLRQERTTISCPNTNIGLATLLMEEERSLRHELTGWTLGLNACPNAIHTSLHSPLRSECPIHSMGSVNVGPFSLLRSIFESFKTSVYKPSLLNAVEHFGRVYNPAIITVLMHARDREHQPLDFSHPAIQNRISKIIQPQKEFHLIRCIRSSVPPTDLIDFPYPTQLAISMGSELAKVSLQLSPNLNKESDWGICSSASSDGATHENSSFVQGAEHLSVSPEHPIAPSAGRVRSLPKCNKSTDQQAICGWSGFNTMETDHSVVDTLTGSFYGTEDAATTEDWDETEDAMSESSFNDAGNLIDNFLNDPPGEGMTTPYISLDDHIYRSPLAVPEVLTTSTITTGSDDVEVPNSEDDSHALSSPQPDLLICTIDRARKPSAASSDTTEHTVVYVEEICKEIQNDSFLPTYEINTLDSDRKFPNGVCEEQDDTFYPAL